MSCFYGGKVPGSQSPSWPEAKSWDFFLGFASLDLEYLLLLGQFFLPTTTDRTSWVHYQISRVFKEVFLL